VIGCPFDHCINVWTAPWSTVMQLGTKYLRLSIAVTLGSRFADWIDHGNRPSSQSHACFAIVKP
jgi:hypothetical protein